MSKRIGLVGEDPNDTTAIQNLLKKKYPTQFTFVTLIKRIRGDQLENEKAKRALAIEVKSNAPDIVLFVRDADAFESQTERINARKKWYQGLATALSNQIPVLLLNIVEIEALIFADINTFNRLYKTTIVSGRDVMYINQPKEALMRYTAKTQKKYRQSDCCKLFAEMDVEQVIRNCRYFKAFILELDKLL